MVLKSTDSKTEPRGTLLITGLHQNTEPLTTTIWLHASRQFLILSLVWLVSGTVIIFYFSLFSTESDFTEQAYTNMTLAE